MNMCITDFDYYLVNLLECYVVCLGLMELKLMYTVLAEQRFFKSMYFCLPKWNEILKRAPTTVYFSSAQKLKTYL